MVSGTPVQRTRLLKVHSSASWPLQRRERIHVGGDITQSSLSDELDKVKLQVASRTQKNREQMIHVARIEARLGEHWGEHR